MIKITVDRSELYKDLIKSTVSDIRYQIKSLVKYRIDAEFDEKYKYDVDWHTKKLCTLVHRLERLTGQDSELEELLAQAKQLTNGG